MGGFAANHHLRLSLVFLNMPTLQQPEAYIGHAADLFAAGGHLAQVAGEPFLASIVIRFATGCIDQQREEMMTKLGTEDRNDLDSGSFAFPRQRKEPLENASHVRNAISRFNQVKDVSDDERDAAWKRIKAAARKFDVEVDENSWREIGK